MDRKEPARLYDPTRYILDGKGKRVRPQLVLSAADLFKGDREVAMQAAVAVEVFHIFTLVHDDIMDNSPTRRGKETVHVRWDEPTAILTGDFLLGRTMELLLGFPDHRLRQALATFTDTVRQLCEGQIRDMSFEERTDVTLAEYLQMIDQKTSALLECSLVLGGLSGTAGDPELETLRDIGHHLGRAFQIQDDLLDLTADSASWGKPVGGDLMAAKKTWLLLHALESADGRDRSWFTSLVQRGGATSEEIPEARLRMERMGVIESARSAVLFHSETAASRIASLPAGTGREALTVLTQQMQQRLH
ncbi:MAG: polyprenyl synthetase family protein [Bacteroidetes bacterium]|nr:polyprenyl synthetase family protein [Bacteroidota bacterium]